MIFSLPKFERFSIGEKIENEILSIIELVTEANTVTKYERERFLIKANGKNECLKILVRLCFDMTIIEFKTYINLEKRIQEIGKQIQGWIKYTRANK